MAKPRGEGYGTPLANVGEMVGRIHQCLIQLSDTLTGIPEVTIYAKAEFVTESSIECERDRFALSIIETAEQRRDC